MFLYPWEKPQLMDRKIFTVLVLSLVARVFYFIQSHELWWDAAVYLSMGKYISSLGAVGFWEPIRPLLWPFVLSYAQFFTIDPVLWGHIWTTAFSLGIIYFTYRIALHLFDQRIALMSSILLSFTWVFLFFNVRLYTEIPLSVLCPCRILLFLERQIV